MSHEIPTTINVFHEGLSKYDFLIFTKTPERKFLKRLQKVNLKQICLFFLRRFHLLCFWRRLTPPPKKKKLEESKSICGNVRGRKVFHGL